MTDQPETSVSSRRWPAWAPWVLLALITAVGAWLRLAHLGDRGLPGDELEMLHFCQRGTSAWGILRGEVKDIPMMVLLPAMIKGLQETFHLEPTPAAIRLPGALLGILCIPLMFLAGRRLFGVGGGLLAAGLIAINPVHIQCSMEAYPYILSVTGFALGLVVVLAVLDAVRADRKPGVTLYVLLAVAMILMARSSIAAWPFVGLVMLAFAAPCIAHWRGVGRRALIPVGIMVVITTVVMAHPLWKSGSAWIAQRGMSYGNAKYHVGGVKLFDPDGLYFLTNFAWGQTPMRAALTAMVLALGLAALWRRRREMGLWLIVGMIVLGYGMTMVARYVTANSFHSRFLMPLLPAYHLILVAGILLPWQCACRRVPRAIRAVLCGAWLLVLTLPLLGPADTANRVQGNPFPYRRIVAWADAQFAQGTPVLCDRFFDAYNEFMVNPATNVVFMSTIPNEPVERFEQMHWRDTAIEFLQNNPDAAFYEAKMFWDKLGRWDWPHQYFARREQFFDQSFAALHEIGLSYREYSRKIPREDMPRTIYYNTPEDLIGKARTEGRSAFGLFGRGWSYTKTQDYRDWRVIQETGDFDVYNVEDHPITVTLRVAAIAKGADKAIQIQGGGVVTFPLDRAVQADLGPLTMQPGKNTIRLRGTQAEAQASALLVHHVEVIVAGVPLP